MFCKLAEINLPIQLKSLKFMSQTEIEKSIITFLVKAVQNGWNSKRFEKVVKLIATSLEYKESIEIVYAPISHQIILGFQHFPEDVYVDLDAFISHHEDGEISFVEALCLNDSSIEDCVWQLQSTYNQSLYNAIRCEWNVLFTFQRLTWFLGVFKHLL